MTASVSPTPGRSSLSSMQLTAILVLTLVTGLILGVDLARLLLASGEPTTPSLAEDLRALSLKLQYGRTVVAVALFGLCWRVAALGRDRLIMGVVALLVLVADWLIILAGELVMGVMTFLVVQLLLIARHGRGVQAALREPTKRRYALMTYGVLFVLNVLSGPLLIGPLTAAGLIVPLGAYGVVLTVSVALALTSGLTGALPQPEARYAGVGMAFFALCDLTVALGAAHAGTLTGLLADTATGIAYGPALALLALSMPKS
jgi:hypothetical protein